MAYAKDCPKCGRVNPPDAQRCSCGHRLSTWRMTEPEPECEGCGARAETRYVVFHQNIGLLVVRLRRAAEGNMCWECINQRFWAMTGLTLALGWWGIISFFVTPFDLINNVARYLGCLRMGSSPRAGSRAVRPRQLVGQDCARCGGPISSIFDSRYCRACGVPVHIACARPGEGTGCPGCGAPATPHPLGS